MSPQAPPRLFVYLAREAPLAVVLRRGPSDWARLSLWHTESDVFEHGQWIKARIYERRSDLSADGTLFVAFVRQSGGRSETDSWVALSRPPWFTALAVWRVAGTYHTGGFFPDRSSIWVGFADKRPDAGMIPEWLRITAPTAVPYIDGTNDWTDRTVHFNRLLRDGWTLVRDGKYETVWERPHPERRWSLWMKQRFEDFTTFGGPYVVDYWVDTGAAVEGFERVAWADWDQNGRLVLARQGRLLRWEPGRGLSLVENFIGQVPDPQPAPNLAMTWPARADG